MNHQTIPITPTYSMNESQTVITRIVVAPNYDADTNPWVGYDAICLWFKAMRRWPIRTASVTIGLTWISIFGLCFVWNGLIARQQASKSPDLFNPAQVGWAMGGGLGTQTVNYANQAVTPTLASFSGGSRQFTNAELRRSQRSDALQTVPVSNNR